MAMKNPPHPGEFIRDEILAPLALTVTKAAEVLGVQQSRLSDLLNGHSNVSAEIAFRLEKAFGVRMELLLRMQAGYDAAQMRRREIERTNRQAARLNAEMADVLKFQEG